MILKLNIKNFDFFIIFFEVDDFRLEMVEKYLEFNSKLLNIFEKNVAAFNRMLVDHVMEQFK